MLKYLGVFFGVIVLDFIWGKYIQATAGSNAVRAGAWSVPVYLLGAYVTITYVGDASALIPAGFGAFVGTYLSVKYKDKF